MTQQPHIVGANVDTWLLNVVLLQVPASLAEELDALKQMAQEAEDDPPTRWTFCGETMYVKPHGSQRQWRWILHRSVAAPRRRRRQAQPHRRHGACRRPSSGSM